MSFNQENDDNLTICSNDPEGSRDEKAISHSSFREEDDTGASKCSHRSKDDVQVEDKNEDDGVVESSQKNYDEIHNKEKNDELYSSCNDSSSENENVDDNMNLSELDELLDAGNNPFFQDVKQIF